MALCLQKLLSDPTIGSAQTAIPDTALGAHGWCMSAPLFPIAAFRALRFRAGVLCPHCDCTRIAPWGSSSGRRRYRCQACLRTFSDFTGTPFAHLKRLDACPMYCLCLLLGVSVRLAAALSRIHRDTAFRWRHRFLAAIRTEDRRNGRRRPPLSGAIHLGDHWLPYSEKGARSLDRPPRRCGFRGLSFETRAAWIAIACGDESGADAELAGSQRPHVEVFAHLLGDRATAGATLVSSAGEYGPAGLLAQRAGCRFERLRLAAGGHMDAVGDYRRSLVVWLERFRGVATKYLDNYLRWHGWVAAPPQWRCEPFPWLIGTTTPADREPRRSAPGVLHPRWNPV